MPPATKRDFGVVILDLYSLKRQSLEKFLLKFCAFRFDPCRASVDDSYDLIFCNSKDTTSDRYPNVNVPGVTLSEGLQLDHLRDCIEHAQAEAGYWLDGLSFALKRIKDSVGEKGVITLQIIFLTSLDKTNQTFDQHKIDAIIQGLNEHNIYLYIIGPDIEFPHPILSTDDISEVMCTLSLDESNSSLITAQQIVQATNHSIMCNIKLGFDLLWNFRKPKGAQPWKVPLSFGNRLEISAMTVGALKRDKPVSLKAKVKRKTQFVLAEDESIIVDKDDVISGIVLHNKFIQIENNDMFKEESNRGNDIVGFTDKENVPEIYLRSESTYYIIPNPSDGQRQCDAFYNLVDVLFEQNKYAIMRRVYRKNDSPKYFALIPEVNETPKCFIMTLLPNADDLIANLKYDTDTKTINLAIDTDFTDFFNSLDITQKNCMVKVPLGPQMMMIPSMNTLADIAVNKELSEKYSFEDIEYNLLDQEENPFAEVLKKTWETGH